MCTIDMLDSEVAEVVADEAAVVAASLLLLLLCQSMIAPSETPQGELDSAKYSSEGEKDTPSTLCSTLKAELRS